MIFYRVVSPSAKLFGNLCPSISHQSMCKKQDPLFPRRPIVFFDVGTKMIMPSFSALLAHSSCV